MTYRNDEQRTRKQTMEALSLYALLAVCIVLSVLPYIWAAVAVLVLFTALLIWAYILRGKSAPDSLTNNHAAYMVRTLWSAAFLSVITIIVASLYLYTAIDPLPFQPCAGAVLDLAFEYYQRGQWAMLAALIRPCLPGFLETNAAAFTISALIAAGPVLAYLIIRLVKGAGRALKREKTGSPRHNP